MKKIMFAAVVMLAAISVVPSGAKARTISTKTVRFAATTPCALACSYWVNPADPTRQVEAMQKSLIDGDDSDFDKQTSYACTAPGPAGSYRDIVLTVPRYVDHIKVVATPTYDWDLVLCKKPAHGNNGAMVGFEEQEGSLSLERPDDACVIGCTDTIIAKVTAGRKYVLRGYSWADPDALTARIYWQDW